ncbi:hypothetical protein [Intrasporangium sp. DVR]|uniref:hypothetical protein n=1 Tax=Intrasporangium sp. DVR TaxID=3127867 RepID=UPI00313A4EE8
MTGRPGFGTDAAAAGAVADPATLRALDRGRRVSDDLADQLLTHLPDLGDIGTQRALDTWVEQAADTLRAVSEALEERLIDVGRAAPGPTVWSGPAARTTPTTPHPSAARGSDAT